MKCGGALGYGQGVRRGLFVPPFGELAHPDIIGELAVRAEAAGWDGVFLWDHVLYTSPADEVLDPWIALAVAAERTSRVRLGAMVTPLPRRRPVMFARQIAALDLLSKGRMIVGVGIGGDGGREFSAFGEELDEAVRGRMLDEGIGLVRRLLSGERVEHHGEFYRADDVCLLPAALQQPVPLWVAARWPNRAPLRRAVAYEGAFVIDLETPSTLRALAKLLLELGAPDPFDTVIELPAGVDFRPWEDAGATWVLTRFTQYGVVRSDVQAIIDAGPRADG